VPAPVVFRDRCPVCLHCMLLVSETNLLYSAFYLSPNSSKPGWPLCCSPWKCPGIDEMPRKKCCREKLFVAYFGFSLVFVLGTVSVFSRLFWLCVAILRGFLCSVKSVLLCASCIILLPCCIDQLFCDVYHVLTKCMSETSNTTCL